MFYVERPRSVRRARCAPEARAVIGMSPAARPLHRLLFLPSEAAKPCDQVFGA
jgi:hypothetical protein